MGFFYQNLDFLYLLISIGLIATAASLDDLIRIDKIERYNLRFLVVFLLLQALAEFMEVFLISVPGHVRLEFIRIPLIIISFSFLLETLLYSISTRRRAAFIRWGVYAAVAVALITLGILRNTEGLALFVQAYSLVITLAVFIGLLVKYGPKKHNASGIAGIVLVFIYSLTFCLTPNQIRPQMMMDGTNNPAMALVLVKLAAMCCGCYFMWVFFNNEAEKGDVGVPGVGFSKHLFAIIFITVLCAGWLCVDFVGKLAEKEKKSYLEQQGYLMSSALSVSHISNLVLSSEMGAERSRSLLEIRLNSISSSLPGLRSIYLLSMQADGHIRHELEIEPTAYKIFNSPAGRVESRKSDFIEKVRETFAGTSANIYAPMFNRSGVWTTTLVPVINPSSGQAIAVLGMDMDYLAWELDLFNFRLFPVLFTLFLSLFMIFIFRELANRRKIGQDLLNRTRDLTILNMTLRKTKEELENANKTKSEFLSNMSHELRTPLNAILGFSEVLIGEMFGSLTPKYREYSQLIHKSGEHLLLLINDVLDISKIEAGKMQVVKKEFSLLQLLQDCFNIAAAYPGAHERNIVTAFPETDITMYADERMLKQIILNLLSNAVKFTPKGGEIKVSVSYDDNDVKLIVADKGIGISETNIKKILEPFGQVESAQSKEYQGSGLGLSIVVKLIEMHGGTLAISSELGTGTTVEAILPRQCRQ